MKFDNSNKLPASAFSWDKFIGKIGYAQSEIVKDCTKNPWELNNQYNLIGWIEASKLIIRQRSEGIAIMIEDKETFERIWLHWLE